MPALRRRRVQRFAVLVEQLACQNTGRGFDVRAALSYGLIAEAPLNFLPRVLIHDGFVLASITNPFVTDLPYVDRVREQFVKGSAREGPPPRKHENRFNPTFLGCAAAMIGRPSAAIASMRSRVSEDAA
jgi:hypothetical protein